MIRKISTSELRVGMYVHSLGRSWMDHPFVKSHFMVDTVQTIQKIASSGIREVVIDTLKGVDIQDVSLSDEVLISEPQGPNDRDKSSRLSVAEESTRAKALYREATSVIHNMMRDARLGKQVEVQSLDPLAERMVQSTIRSSHAFSGISRIKTKDEYTFMHCVSVAGLMTAFAVEIGLDEETIHQVAIGGMVHDIGKTLVPDKILNKPGKLDRDEFGVMRQHVDFSDQLLKEHTGLSQVARDVTLLHHERMDGSGYPHGLKDDQISLVGQMSAIVDVYDALTSVRVYKDAWEPAVTLKKLLEWCPDHFNPELVQKFIKCLGIYPVGSLVELDSGRVGIVMEQGANMLRPQLRIIYNTKQNGYVRVTELDLAKELVDKIKGVRSPSELGIDLANFL
ncbi:MAG: HD-GYP domain-containing protein [Gammaproteobacteria bacterium]|nr:HD-GYP domain-containing protein [Gammaproteobacteria bacterium]